jgi:hypothetical protein
MSVFHSVQVDFDELGIEHHTPVRVCEPPLRWSPSLMFSPTDGAGCYPVDRI